MNKRMAILGASAGAVCGLLMTVGLPSFASFDVCNSDDMGSIISRELSWSGSNAVEVRLPADVHFKSAPQWAATVRGPSELLKHIRFLNGRLEFDESLHVCKANIEVEMSGPSVRQWTVAGSGDLKIEQLDQPEVIVAVTGSGSITASGKVEHTQAAIRGSGDIDLQSLAQTELDLSIQGSGSATAAGNAQHARVAIAGSGDAHLGKLNVKSADVTIRGSGDAEIAAEEAADVEIKGSGDVRLSRRPKSLQSRVHGSGSVITG